MKFVRRVLIAAMIGIGFVLGGCFGPADGDSGKPATALVGVVVSVDASAKTIVVMHKDGRGPRVTVGTDARTAIRVNGKPAGVGDIAVGMDVMVVPPVGTASEIRAYMTASYEQR